jgi:4'-phosphopantetheinyl transferase EntD
VPGIGIDAEPNGPLPDGVLDLVAGAPEQAMLAALAAADPGVHWERLLFSAKEAVYKAWYPLTGRWLGFPDARVRIDAAAGSFRAEVLVPADRADGGAPLDTMEGRFLVERGLVVTAVAVR